MVDDAFDAAFARHVRQIGLLTPDQVAAAMQLQVKSRDAGTPISLAAAFVQAGTLTEPQKSMLEKMVREKQAGAQQVGPYRLTRKLGEGGMGAVYLAVDPSTSRRVAVKVLPRHLAANVEFVKRFRREAEAAAKLKHLNIIGALAAGEETGFHYYVMEYFEGFTLDALLTAEKVLPSARATDLILQAARGLKYAHDQAVIHRDIKPSNIFLTRDGTAKLLDLGLSKNLDDMGASFKTVTGAVLGTPHYISPEQALGEKSVDGRTDIYSLGATFYHLITGQTPFDGTTILEILSKHLNTLLPNPQDLREDIPDRVVHVVSRMMAKAPHDRYANADALISDLEDLAAGREPRSQPISAYQTTVQLQRRRPPLKRPPTVRRLAPTRRSSGRPALVGGGIVAVFLIAFFVLRNGPAAPPVEKPSGKPQGKATAPKPVSEPSQRSSPPKESPSVPVPEPATPLARNTEPPVESWTDRVAGLSPADQVDAVNARLKELNPRYDGRVTPRIEGGTVTELLFSGALFDNLAPLAALRRLRRIDIGAWHLNNSILDLTPLSGLPLVFLNLGSTGVVNSTVLKGKPLTDLVCGGLADLSVLEGMPLQRLYANASACTSLAPLRGMRLTELGCNYTRVSDLSPLQGMPLIHLDVMHTDVNDLTPIRGMPIRTLNVIQTRVTDLSPLQDMPLGQLYCDFKPERDRAILRSIPTLGKINGIPASDFWRNIGTEPSAPASLKLDLGEGISIEFLPIAPGSFTMGGIEGNRVQWQRNEKPPHRVTLTRGYYLGKHKVTRGQFAAFVKATGYRTEAEREGSALGYRSDGSWGPIPGASWRDVKVFPQTDEHPVVCVSWNDATAFCAWAAKKTMRKVGLPTEAQWEYACRAGTATRWASGEDEARLRDFAWYAANSGGTTHPVGRKKPNAWGLYDILGNAWEWCADWEAPYTGEAVDPTGPGSGTMRCLRGGGWGNDAFDCRSAFRNSNLPSYRTTLDGFRAALP